MSAFSAYPTADIYDSRSDRFDDIQWIIKIGICICHNANPNCDIIRPFFPRDDHWSSSKASQSERVLLRATTLRTIPTCASSIFVIKMMETGMY